MQLIKRVAKMKCNTKLANENHSRISTCKNEKKSEQRMSCNALIKVSFHARVYDSLS